MTGTGSDDTRTQGVEETHGESHASMSDRNSRRKSHVDTSAEFPQVRKSRGSEEKVTRPLPRKVTFSGLSIGRPERDTERGEINKTPTAEDGPEPIGAIAERVLTDLAPHRRDAIRRLARAHTTSPLYRKEQQP